MSAIPENVAPFSLAEVLAMSGGELHGSLALGTVLRGVSTDSRAALGGKLFVALRGERFDGHEFLGAAAQAGALAALVERDIAEPPLPLVRVPSTLGALGQLGHAHRSRFRGKLVAVAGSAGKTTTRAAIGAVLELAAPGQVHQVRGNLNNLIGVPHVLFGLNKAQRYAVLEIGTNAPGEVAALTQMAEPDLAVLTLIDIEHTEGLGDLDGVEREEGALLAALGESQIAVVNGDDARAVRQLERSPAGRKLLYGFNEGADVRAVQRDVAGLGAQRLVVDSRGRRLELEVPLLGEAGAYAALAALAVAEALELEVDVRALGEALARAAEPGRLRAVELGGGVLLDDVYNANPASVLSSLSAARELSRVRGARLVLVLGEMRELGAASREQHAKIGRAAAESGARTLVAVGGDAELYVEPARAAGLRACFAADAAEGLELVRAELEPGDVVLVKASRGVRAERIVEGLLDAQGRAP